MRRVFNAIGWSLVLAIAAVMLWPQTVGAQPVLFRVQAETGNDTLFYGDTCNIIFTVDPNGNELSAVIFPLVLYFSNGNIVGPVRAGAGFVYPSDLLSQTMIVFDDYPPQREGAGSDPDTLLFLFYDMSGPILVTAREVSRIVFLPQDTGLIAIDSTTLPPAQQLRALDMSSNTLPIVWESPPITVVMPPCAVALTGDVDEDGLLTAMDIIAMVNYVFRGGSPPAPCHAAMDVNCDGIPERSGADILYTVNYVYKSGPPPCDVCPLIWNGTWECE